MMWSLFRISLSGGYFSEPFESFQRFLSSSRGNSSTVWTPLSVADHLAHLYQDTVHARRLSSTHGIVFLQKSVGDCYTVSKWRCVILIISGPSSAKISQPTAHRCQHQHCDKSWIELYIIFDVFHFLWIVSNSKLKGYSFKPGALKLSPNNQN